MEAGPLDYRFSFGDFLHVLGKSSSLVPGPLLTLPRSRTQRFSPQQSPKSLPSLTP